MKTDPRPKGLLVVEDDPVFRAHLIAALTRSHPGVTPIEAATGAEAFAILRENPRLGLALVDLGLPDMDGVELIDALHWRDPDLPILVVSVIASERSVLGAIRAGARGYILKSGSEASIVQGVRDVLSGNYPLSPALARHLFKLAGGPAVSRRDALPQLSPREAETLRHIARGLTYEQTAIEMGVSLSTVQSHIRRLYRKLEVNSQMQAARKARDSGLI